MRSEATVAQSRPVPATLLHFVFFVSGFSAILYQLVWQRSLFTIYGTSSESVTMVVTAFMLGLGLGSLAGGVLSQSSSRLLPALFVVAELAIGAFGLGSLELFHRVASITSGASGLEVGVTALALLLVPTTCMGATLPILVTYSVGGTRNVGSSVGMLYFANTFGSAAGCVVAAHFIFERLGQSGAVQLAAGGNALAAACVMAALLYRRMAR